MNARRRALLVLSAAKFQAQGLELRAMRAEEMVSFGRTEITKWAELVKRSGAQVD
jgi:hypothetical protein